MNLLKSIPVMKKKTYDHFDFSQENQINMQIQHNKKKRHFIKRNGNMKQINSNLTV